MKYGANEIKTGFFLFVSILILLTFLIAIFGINYGIETKEYLVYLRYAGGITKGSLVKYMGMDVGQVTEIELPRKEASHITITFRVKSTTPVRIDSKAFVTSVGIMSDFHIEITPGSGSAAFLPPNSIIDSKDVMGYAQIAEEIGGLSIQLKGLISKLDDSFNDKNRSHLASMMANIDSLVQEQREPLSKTMDNMEHLSRELSILSKDINKLVANNKVNFDEIMSNLQTTLDVSNQAILNLNNAVANIEFLISDNNTNITETLENIQNTSNNLEDFTRILKERPWLLVRKAAPPEREF